MTGPTVPIADRVVGSGRPCYVIAEIGSNHDGDLDRALALIEMVAEAGADAAKFQLFRAGSLYPPNCGTVPTPAEDLDFFAVLSDLELPAEWLPAMGASARECGIDLFASPFDEATLDLLIEAGHPAVKIASAELSHLPLISRAAATGLPLLLSTGMATVADIDEALGAAADARSRVVLLQCVTAYPAPEEEANLRVIPALREAFGVPVGLSDHTLDARAAPLVAAAVGAAVIEKHVTYDRSAAGPDHSFAIEPDELGGLVTAVKALSDEAPADRLPAVARELGDDRVERLLGDGRKHVAPSEALLAACDRRAIHAVRDLAPGERIGAEDIAILRGERNLRPGLHPRFVDVVAGAVCRRHVSLGAGIEWADLIERAP